ncbi:NAD-dependent epimerase/dehydratase family protein [Sphingorhabdus contaminans]|uniref:NAD(P)-dependent oxidoreductase n=1 Tax=Sphingorhabdus contaminans TaxID=1343899 RepID=A0A553WAU6_9SPHN|nr:NAD(P)-dependent oxidoreductase [Sphingorhabdus contaminans]TSB01810.1 NAD(P)-dependent oxidoreductase [Sphingorhabdus contaminans]
MTRQRIAVTGASGAIGSRLAALLQSRGFSVVALQRDTAFSHGEGIEIRPFSLSDTSDTIAEHLHDVDQLVHLAAIIPGKVPGSEGDAALWNVNVLGTQRLVEAMAMAKVKRLVLTGTANVYRADQAEASEESPFGPQSRVLYLASKAAQEWLAASMCNEHDIDHAILRISSVIGDGRSIIDKLAGDLAKGIPVQIQDGAAFGADFIDCDDVCAGLLLAVETELSGVYNLSSGQRTELIDILIKLAEILGRPSDAIQMVHANRAPDTGFPAINSDRLQSFGFKPKPLQAILQRIAASAAGGTKAA